MKITKSYLKSIIKEELQKISEEQMQLSFMQNVPTVKSTDQKRAEEEKKKQQEEERKRLQIQLDALKKQLSLFDTQTSVQRRELAARATDKDSLTSRIKGLEQQLAGAK